MIDMTDFREAQRTCPGGVTIRNWSHTFEFVNRYRSAVSRTTWHVPRTLHGWHLLDFLLKFVFEDDSKLQCWPSISTIWCPMQGLLPTSTLMSLRTSASSIWPNFLIPCNESVVTLTPTPCVRARFSHPFGARHLPSIHPQSTVRSFGYHALEKGLAPAITRSQKSCENRRPVPSETHSPCMTKAVQKPTRHSGHRGKRTPHWPHCAEPL